MGRFLLLALKKGLIKIVTSGINYRDEVIKLKLNEWSVIELDMEERVNSCLVVTAANGLEF